MNIKYGTFTGTGAAVNVELGFLPAFVMILNVTDGDMVGMYIKGGTSSIDIDAAAGPATDASGITEYTGSTSASVGFSVDAGNSESGKTYRYIAIAGD